MSIFIDNQEAVIISDIKKPDPRWKNTPAVVTVLSRTGATPEKKICPASSARVFLCA